MSAKGHYLLLVFPSGKDEVRREYVPLLAVDETPEEVIDRWVEAELGDRQRNRAKTERALRASFLYTRICRPSSWHRAQPPLTQDRPKTRRKR